MSRTSSTPDQTDWSPTLRPKTRDGLFRHGYGCSDSTSEFLKHFDVTLTWSSQPSWKHQGQVLTKPPQRRLPKVHWPKWQGKMTELENQPMFSDSAQTQTPLGICTRCLYAHKEVGNHSLNHISVPWCVFRNLRIAFTFICPFPLRNRHFINLSNHLKHSLRILTPKY